MNTVNYSTGRTYDTAQVLEITILSDIPDEFGLREVKAMFNDASRHIKGSVHVILFENNIGKAVLEAYDSGRYIAI
jgi:hypothetical protein